MNHASIYSYSVVYSSSVDFQDQTPYLCAIVEQADGQRIASFVQGYAEGTEVAIGQQVYGLHDGSTEAYSLFPQSGRGKSL